MLSRKHSPGSPRERQVTPELLLFDVLTHYLKQRVEEHGTEVRHFMGTWRVEGTMAVSRSIGDCHLPILSVKHCYRVLKTLPQRTADPNHC
jgi:hypothetical protein